MSSGHIVSYFLHNVKYVLHQIVKKLLNCKKIYTTDKLRERFFGNYEKTSNKNYQKVWNKDSLNENNNDSNDNKKYGGRVCRLE